MFRELLRPARFQNLSLNDSDFQAQNAQLNDIIIKQVYIMERRDKQLDWHSMGHITNNKPSDMPPIIPALALHRLLRSVWNGDNRINVEFTLI